VGDIGDMDADTPTAGNALHIDGVVEVWLQRTGLVEHGWKEGLN
jgi:hypothetical protein